MPDREHRIRGRGHPLPFSKGRMATTLFLAGFEPERAYALARQIESEVAEVAEEVIPLDRLHELVESVLEREEGGDAVARYHWWQQVTHLDRPLILMLGGATGTGKSSLATEIAYRLGISRITSTDVVRQVMRAFFSRELMPALHFSSFEAGAGLKMPMPDPDMDHTLYGFIQQAEQLAVGMNAVIQRALVEGLSTVVEGIHLVPGLVQPHEHAGAVVVQAMLCIEDEESHQAHFYARDFESGGLRPMERYLRGFGEIRRIQDYLVARAEREGVPVIDTSDSDRALSALMDLIVRSAIAPGE